MQHGTHVFRRMGKVCVDIDVHEVPRGLYTGPGAPTHAGPTGEAVSMHCVMVGYASMESRNPFWEDIAQH